MFDQDFDDPSYDMGGDYDSGGYDQPKYNLDMTGKVAGAKKVIPLVIVAIVALVILVFVITFLGSQNEVTINIEELGGGTVSSATLTINQNGSIVYGPERGTSHTMTLANGAYNYTIISKDHKKSSGPLDIDPETQLYPIELEKDIEAELRIEASFDTIYEGQKLNGVIIIEADSEIDDVLLLAKDSKNVLDVEFTPTKVNLNNGGAVSINFTVEIDDDLDESETTKLEISLAGTKINDKLELIANPTVAIEDLPAGDDVDEEQGINEDSYSAGDEQEILEISFDNDNKTIDIVDLYIEVTAESGYESKLSWFEFANYEDIKTKAKIDLIQAKEENTINLFVSIPISAQVDDDFKGTLIVNSDSLEAEKKYDIYLRVKKSAEVQLELTKDSVSTDCLGDSCVTIQFNLEGVALKNKGSATVTNIKLSIDEAQSNPECIDWFEIIKDTITTLEPGAQETLNINVTPNWFGQEEYACYLNWTFDNPTNGLRETLFSDPPIKVSLDHTEPK